jgi:metallo-beta-lactamase class B
MIRYSVLFAITFFLDSCTSAKISDKSYAFDKITIERLKDNVYRHTTFLQSETFGKVSCNGMIVFDKNEAVIFDTPIDDAMSAELINWVADSLHCKIIAVIPTHFHEDCLGGLAEFHRRGIPSYAEKRTIASAKVQKYPVPQNGFDERLELKAGRKSVVAEFVGEGHTRDNVIGYFPDEQVLFGGCLIKEVGAGKGNLADANVNDWSATVTKLKSKYSLAQIVIPGHGKTGGAELLDYTIKLFVKNN